MKEVSRLDHAGVCWFLNSPVTEEGVRRHARAFREAGFSSLLPIPICNGTANRSKSQFRNSGMQCDYLSEEFFGHYARVVRACHDAEMPIWVWDDDFCPACWAGGAMVKTRPELRGKIVYRIGQSDPPPPNAVRTLCERDGRQYVLALEAADSSRIDVFHPDAGAHFVKLNYETYFTHFGEFFGRTLVGFFTDEPGIPGCLGGLYRLRDSLAPMPLPWTDDLPALWKGLHGGDLVELLPSLFMDSGDSPAARQAREGFGALINRLWVERWMSPCRDWCRSHGVTYTGHLNNDDYVEARLKSSGNLPNSLRFFDMPGIDVVVHHILPDKERQPSEGLSVWDVNRFNSDFPRFASSAARAASRGRAMCELGDAYGWGCDLELRKWLLDYNIARGIDFIFWGSAVCSLAGSDVMATSGNMGPEQPYWPFWNELNRCYSNVLGMLCKGSRCARAAIFYPAGGYMGGGSQLNERLDALAAFLRGNGVDFDYVESLSDSGAPYEQIFVPAGSPLSADEVAWLEKKAGQCKVYAPSDRPLRGATPYSAPACAFLPGKFMEFAAAQYGDLGKFLKPDLSVAGLHEMCLHKREVAPGEYLLFVFNESATGSLEFTLPSHRERFACAPEEDVFAPLDAENLSLAPGESILLFLGKRETIASVLGKKVQPLRRPQRTMEVDPSQCAFVSAMECFWDGKNFERRALTERQYKERGRGFSGEVVRRLTLPLGERGDMALSMPQFRGAAAIRVNGAAAGSVIGPPKKLFIPKALLREGENQIEMTLCNTLANHVRSPEFRQRAGALDVRPNVYFEMTAAADRRTIETDSVSNEGRT